MRKASDQCGESDNVERGGSTTSRCSAEIQILPRRISNGQFFWSLSHSNGGEAQSADSGMSSKRDTLIELLRNFAFA